MAIEVLWWGYLDTDGDIHVKKYVNDRAIENTERLPFCQGIFEPFYAANHHIAKQMCYERVHLESNINWKGKH